MDEEEVMDRSEMTPQQLAEAIEFFGCIDVTDEESDCKPPLGDAVIEWGDEGHSGPGWYIYCNEYPEEGATFISPNEEPFPELAAALKAQEERDGDMQPALEPQP